MTKIRLKQIEKIKVGELSLGNILSFTGDGFFENIYKISSSTTGLTIPARDSKGNIQVGDAVGTTDAINLKTLSSALQNIEISNSISDSVTIKVIKTVGEKDSLKVIPAGVSGNLQKNLGNELAQCSYIFEDTTKKSIEIARSSMYKSASPISSLLLITHVNAGQDYDPEVAIETSSFNLEKGCSITLLTSRQNTDTPGIISKNYIKANQSLFKLSVNGYTSSTSYDETFNFEVKSMSDFNTGISSIFSLRQSVNGTKADLISSNVNGDILFGYGLCLSTTNSQDIGMMRFNGMHFQGYNGVNWVNLDESYSGSPEFGGNVIIEDITATTNCGGFVKGDVISAGTTFDELVFQLLAPYVPPAFNNFSVVGTIYENNEHTPYNDTTIECGEIFEPTDAKIVSIVDSEGLFASECKITGTGFSDAAFLPDSIEVTVDSNIEQSVSYISPTTETWYASGKDYSGNDVSLAYTMSWMYCAYFGASSVDIIDIRELNQKTYIVDNTISFQCTSDNALGDNYTYLAIPKVVVDGIGDSMTIRRNFLNITGAFSVSEITLNTPSGDSVLYYLYKSNATGAFSSGNTIRVK